VCAALAPSVYKVEIAREEADLEDFEAFFRRAFPPIARSLGLMLANREEGIDVAQEAFARAFARWDRYESLEHAKNSVLRIAVNLAKSDARKRRRFSSRDVALNTPSSAPSGFPVEDRLVLLDALRSLSGRQRTCAVLSDYLGMDSSEISKLLRIPSGSVRTHLTRGRRKLRTLLQRSDEEAP
jgi:RNA polymerase sigma-70 factor, ECF subfamily